MFIQVCQHSPVFGLYVFTGSMDFALFIGIKIEYHFITMFQRFCGVLPLLFLAIGLFAQTVSRSDGENVYYYDTLFEAVSAAADVEVAVGRSVEFPDEITLLADLVLDEPILVNDGVHIRLTAGGADKMIRRGGGNIEFPMIWVKGDSASLTLGKPDMEFELVIDGGYDDGDLASIKAHAPLAAVSGPDAKLIMYDKVTLQNNYNNGDAPTTSHYQNGAGIFIRTEGDAHERQAEFIMKGGIIRGNINDLQSVVAGGGGVYISGFGVFTMEGGVIMDNIARITGGGALTGSRGSIIKIGGIIYGKNAPAGLRNIALTGSGTPKFYGHSIIVYVFDPVCQYRDDTVYDYENLGYIGSQKGNGAFGEGDKWDNPDKVFRRRVFVIVLSALVFGVGILLIAAKILFKKRLVKIQQIAEVAPEVDFGGLNLTAREKEICKLFLTELTFKEIASALGISNSGVAFHSQNIYRKLGIQSRTELFVKLLKKE
jgi:DNA-binding CsgD family transcriptional regulator